MTSPACIIQRLDILISSCRKLKRSTVDISKDFHNFDNRIEALRQSIEDIEDQKFNFFDDEDQQFNVDVTDLTNELCPETALDYYEQKFYGFHQQSIHAL